MSDRGIVIVGAGIGGLAAAIRLAAAGRAVTVVEAASTPGGKLRQVMVDGDPIDAGPTVFTLRGVFDELFAAAGSDLEAHLSLHPAETLARHAWGEARLDLFADPARSEAAIGEFAGGAEARGYRAFRAEAKRLHDALDRPFLRATKVDPIRLGWRMGARGFADYCTLRPYSSMWSALGGYFRDPRLRQLFGRYATYCGSSPFQAPATLMLIAHVEASGVWLIEGGMYALVRALETAARGSGVRFRYGERVAGIATERGRAAGVTLAGGETIAADAVICNADPAALAAGRFGGAAARAVGRVPPARRSLSAMVWMGKARASGFPLSRHNVLFSGDYPAEFAALGAGRLADEPTVYLCAQDRDAGAGSAPAPGGPERVQIIVNAPANGDVRRYTDEEIRSCRTRMLSSLARAGLSLDWPDTMATVATPADFEALCPSTGGALYGPASHGWAASFRRQGARTRIPGLYCAGGSTHPGAGVPMAALSGSLAAASLLADLVSTSRSRRGATPGGMSTRSARIAASA